MVDQAAAPLSTAPIGKKLAISAARSVRPYVHQTGSFMTHVVQLFAWLAWRIGGDGAELAVLDGSMDSPESCGSWEDIIRESGGVPKPLVVQAACRSRDGIYVVCLVRFTRDNRASHNVQQVMSEDSRIMHTGKGIPYSLPSLP